MIINLALYDEYHEHIVEEDVDFSSLKMPNNYHINKIDNCHVVASFHKYDDFVNMHLIINGVATVICSYTNEPFPYHYHCDEDMVFSSDDNADYYYQGDRINLDEFLIAFITSNIPLAPIKPGTKLPKDNPILLTEAELRERRKNKIDHRWDVLEELEKNNK